MAWGRVRTRVRVWFRVRVRAWVRLGVRVRAHSPSVQSAHMSLRFVS